MINFLINILVFAIVMGTIVFVHELGHLIAAKSFGVYCREFAIGMGPKLFAYQSKKSETVYTIRAFPIGGFVAMAGEPGEEGMDNVPLENTIEGISRWKKLIVLLAGVFMNIVLAFVVFMGIFQTMGVIREPEPIIANVAQGLPAEEAGFIADDRIVKLTFYDGNVVEPKTFSDASIAIMSYEDNPIEVEVMRNGSIVTLEVTPVFNEESNSYVMGIQAYPGSMEKVGIIETMRYTGGYIIQSITQILMVLRLIIRGIGLNNVGGPIAIFQATSEVTATGFDFLYLFNLIGALSISLAVMNLIPIPVLDGGRALLTIVEMIIRRPIPKKFENFVMLLGVAFLLVVMIFFVIKDLSRF